MRFLTVFAAVLGYAAAGLIGPLAYNAGDLQAAAIDSTVAAQDHARAVGEGQARAAEAAHLHTAEAVRQNAELSRDLHENAYWGGVAHSQNVVAAAQSQAAALSGHYAGAPIAHGAYAAAPLAYGAYGAAPLAYGAYGASPLAYGAYGHGVHGW